MAERTGPTDGARYKRAKPSGNHKRKNGKDRHKIDTRNGQTACLRAERPPRWASHLGAEAT